MSLNALIQVNTLSFLGGAECQTDLQKPRHDQTTIVLGLQKRCKRRVVGLPLRGQRAEVTLQEVWGSLVCASVRRPGPGAPWCPHSIVSSMLPRPFRALCVQGFVLCDGMRSTINRHDFIPVCICFWWGGSRGYCIKSDCHVFVQMFF